MGWQRKLVDQLATIVPGGYHARGPIASEPTALAGLALSAYGEMSAARRAADWLGERQSTDGSLGVTRAQPTPSWPTSLAMLLWHTIDSLSATRDCRAHLQRAIAWTLADRGLPNKRQPHIGHDTTLVGWSWAAHTHSWLEPTAMFVLALKSVGLENHPRTREAVRLLVDRLLPTGGANYGNTIVLGQPLLPHIQPTGLAMLALANEENEDPRIERSLNYLERELLHTTATASLCYGLLGLAAHGRRPRETDAWLQRTYDRLRNNGTSCYKLALLALASIGTLPWSNLQRESSITQGAPLRGDPGLRRITPSVYEPNARS